MTREEAIEQLKQIPIDDKVSVPYMKEIYNAIDMAIKSLEADRAIEKTLYAIREEMQYIKVAELQIYGANSWRFSNAIEDIIEKHLAEVSE